MKAVLWKSREVLTILPHSGRSGVLLILYAEESPLPLPPEAGQQVRLPSKEEGRRRMVSQTRMRQDLYK